MNLCPNKLISLSLSLSLSLCITEIIKRITYTLTALNHEFVLYVTIYNYIIICINKLYMPLKLYFVYVGVKHNFQIDPNHYVS